MPSWRGASPYHRNDAIRQVTHDEGIADRQHWGRIQNDHIKSLPGGAHKALHAFRAKQLRWVWRTGAGGNEMQRGIFDARREDALVRVVKQNATEAQCRIDREQAM